MEKAKFGLFKMDAEIPLLTQAHELRANQHFDKQKSKNLLNSQLSEVVRKSAFLTKVSRTEKICKVG